MNKIVRTAPGIVLFDSVRKWFSPKVSDNPEEDAAIPSPRMTYVDVVIVENGGPYDSTGFTVHVDDVEVMRYSYAYNEDRRYPSRDAESIWFMYSEELAEYIIRALMELQERAERLVALEAARTASLHRQRAAKVVALKDRFGIKED